MSSDDSGVTGGPPAQAADTGAEPQGILRRLLVRHAEKLRFGLVGVANTALDFALLFVFVALGVNQYVANYLSTSLSIVFSFVMNRRFTFRSEGSKRREIVPFILVTLTGLWVLQPVLIWLVTTGLRPMVPQDYIVLFAGKLVATVGSLTWNYLLYSRVVFTRRPKADADGAGEPPAE
ncbi:GtrA family protein [Propionicicella superfundia]|uniref:GtrA family protein n=1 Tax=Propionicicella superfundia TaxID=348582 RepID=UPI000685FF24|nr:GtrA family protein [Propionicicella superfundia]